MGDAHCGIIHRIAEEKRRRAIGAPNDEIPDASRLKALGSTNQSSNATVAAAGTRNRSAAGSP